MTSKDGKTPPQLDEDDNLIVVEVVSKSGTSKTPTLEDLMKKLEKLMAENKKLKAKESQNPPLQVKLVSPHLKRKSPIRGGREETSMISLRITLCSSIIITCQTLPLTLLYPLARLPVSMVEL
jgi:hypothetical protein